MTKADRLGTLGPEEQHNGELTGFLSASYTPDLELKKARIQETLMGTDPPPKKKPPNKSLTAIAKESVKGQPVKTGSF